MVLLLGAWLRIHNFDRPGLWIDEYGTWWVIAAEGYAEVAARAWEVQGQSPLYYLIVRGFVDLFGLASWSLRLPSLLLGVLVLWLGYAVTREIFRDRRLALMATAALAIHAPLIRYSQEARPYALALALSLASFALFIRVLRGSGFAGRAAYALVTAATFYAHYLFGFALLVQFGYAMSQRTAARRPTVLALGGAALLMAPGGLQLANLFARRRSLDWAPDPTSVPDALGSVAQTFVDPWPLCVAAVTVVVLLAFGARAWRGDPGDRPGLVLGWLLVPLAVFALVPALSGRQPHPSSATCCSPLPPRASWSVHCWPFRDAGRSSTRCPSWSSRAPRSSGYCCRTTRATGRSPPARTNTGIRPWAKCSPPVGKATGSCSRPDSWRWTRSWPVLRRTPYASS